MQDTVFWTRLPNCGPWAQLYDHEPLRLIISFLSFLYKLIMTTIADGLVITPMREKTATISL